MPPRASIPKEAPAQPASIPSHKSADRRTSISARPSARPLRRLARWLIGDGSALIFGIAAFAILALFSGHRFFHQSKAPHFIWQAEAFLAGSLALVEDPPNLEDWVRIGERFYVSFPAFPALAMLPLVAIFGYHFNDTSFTVAAAALGLSLFLVLLQRLRRLGELNCSARACAVWAALLGFGTLFFYCAIRGEVWFTAEIMGVGLTCLYLLTAVRARHPLLAGLFYSMATLTRTPLAFCAVFFLFEVIWPEGKPCLAALRQELCGKLKKLSLFVAGALPLAVAHMAFNWARFGSISEFGHRFFWNNRVNADIAQWGLFDLHYLPRNLSAAFLKLPTLSLDPLHLGYDPHGMSLFLTTPLFLLLFFPKVKPRLTWALWATAACIALPGFFYQNDGYMQFGFRFSLDYTPYLILLLALGGRPMKSRLFVALALMGIAVNTWGALAFRGYSW